MTIIYVCTGEIEMPAIQHLSLMPQEADKTW